MERIVVYGLGKEYVKQIILLEREFEIVGVSDKNIEKAKIYKNYVKPSDIVKLTWDYIYVTSQKYFGEIREQLNNIYAIDSKLIIGIHDMWWNVANSSTRDQWVQHQLMSLRAGLRILDAGAGNQRYKCYCSHLNYVSQDFGKYDENANNEGIKENEKWKSKDCDIISDIISIPVDNSSFDVILCTEVFEHIKNPILALKEFYRILKPEGILLLTAPFCSLTHMAPYYYANGFSKYWYEDNLKDNGFEVISIQQNGNYFSYLAQELMRVSEMVDQYNGSVLSENEKDLLFGTIKLLMNKSVTTTDSEESLCFGCFVKALKK